MNAKSFGIIGIIIALGSILLAVTININLIFIGSIGVLLFILGMVMSNGEIKAKNMDKVKHIKQLLSNNGIKVDNIIYSLDNNFSLSFNESKEQIYFTNLNEVKQYSFQNIIESRIDENGESITRTSRTGQIGGVLVGGLLAGGIGAAIGGLSANKKNITKIKSVDFVVIVDDTTQPIKKLKLFISGGAHPSDKHYKDIKIQAENWHSLISIFIKRSENTSKVN